MLQIVEPAFHSQVKSYYLPFPPLPCPALPVPVPLPFGIAIAFQCNKQSYSFALPIANNCSRSWSSILEISTSLAASPTPTAAPAVSAAPPCLSPCLSQCLCGGENCFTFAVIIQCKAHNCCQLWKGNCFASYPLAVLMPHCSMQHAACGTRHLLKLLHFSALNQKTEKVLCRSPYPASRTTLACQTMQLSCHQFQSLAIFFDS